MQHHKAVSCKAIAGMGIVCENANFCGSETVCGEENNFLQEKEIGSTKKEKKKERKKEALVLVLHGKPVKHTECINTQL